MALEFVNGEKLINGEKYYVKRKKGIHSMNIKYYHGIFDGYNDFEGFVWFKTHNVSIELHLSLNTFYRHVSKQEFYKKVKEKYDRKCLNIILKRLIDESFQW